MTEPDSRQQFGSRLRAARREAGFTSAAALAEALASYGVDVTAQAVAAWERGEYMPRRRHMVRLIDEVLGTADEMLTLAAMAGDVALSNRLAALEESVARLEAQVKRLDESLGKKRQPRSTTRV